MISPRYAQTMARYAAWMNDGLFAAAATLDDDQRRADQGAYFGSIHATLNHLLWGDQIWMSRLAGKPEPLSPDIPGSVAQYEDFAALTLERRAFDEVISTWAATLDAGWFDGDLTWYSRAMEREVTNPRALLVTHMFNHQTHHRGQVHAMLTRLGVKTPPTDLPFMDL